MPYVAYFCCWLALIRKLWERHFSMQKIPSLPLIIVANHKLVSTVNEQT
jgi:hypothetical protein